MSSKSQAPINSHDKQQEDLTWRSAEAPFSNLISSISTSTSVVIPPTPVAVMFMETYSTHIHYNATLLVDIKSVISQYVAGTTNSALSFSIFALASM
jgi:hypothetical protein